MAVRCLIATCSEYDHHDQVPRTEADGLQVRQALIDRGMHATHIEHLRNFTRAEIFEKADVLAREAHRARCWLIFVAMCHGYEQDGNPFLRPSNSRCDEDDFPLQYLTRQMPEDSGVWFILGTCREQRSQAARPFSCTSMLRRLKQTPAGPEVFFLLPCRLGNPLSDRCNFGEAVSLAIRSGPLDSDLHAVAAAVRQEFASAEVLYRMKSSCPHLSTVLGLSRAVEHFQPNALHEPLPPAASIGQQQAQGEGAGSAGAGLDPAAAALSEAEEAGEPASQLSLSGSHGRDVGAQLIGSAQLEPASLVHDQGPTKMHLAGAEAVMEARRWLPCVFLTAVFVHCVFVLLWYLRLLGVRWSTRVCSNITLISFAWTSINHVGDITSERHIGISASLSSRSNLACAMGWPETEKYAFNVLAPVGFALQAFGELVLEWDYIGSGVSCGLLLCWVIFVKRFGLSVNTTWRSRANDLVHQRAFFVWGLLFVIALVTSGCNAWLLCVSTDEALEWVEKNFYIFQLLFVFAKYFTYVQNCDCSFMGGFHTASVAKFSTGTVLVTFVSLAYVDVEEGSWSHPFSHYFALMCKYVLLCGSAVVWYQYALGGEPVQRESVQISLPRQPFQLL